MNNYFIILAAGLSKRFNSKIPKQYFYYKNKKIFEHSVEKAMNSKLFKKIVLVCNNPKEIPNKYKDILNPYFTTKKNGTGLGLSIVNKIINDHNGKIQFIPISNGAKVEINFILNVSRNINS